MKIGVSPSHNRCYQSPHSAAEKFQMHDDGEKDLGPDIASWSLGGAASMDFKIKSKYWIAKGLTPSTYDPNRWVVPGSQAWKMRLTTNAHYQAGRMAEYEAGKKELFKFLNKDSEKKRKNGPIVLTLEIKHGDMVVMHGERIQEIYEVCIPFFCESRLKLKLTSPSSTGCGRRGSCDSG